tara:strand:- start:71 stop:1282 length:1212 start_codon:yes stop_codon:yes gene_type:complete
MADNIGTITVAIEAQTDELKSGLASAERAVKDSAKKMEQQTENLAQRAEKSWTEFASKMGVIQQVGAIAQQTWNALDGVLTAVTDSTANASQKMTGALDAIEQAGIPIVSQFLAIGRGIGGWISGEKQLRMEIDKRTAAIERAAKAQMEAYEKRQKQRKELTDSTNEFLKLMEDESEMAGLGSDREKLLLKQQRQQEALLEDFTKKQSEAAQNSSQDYLDREQEKFDKAFQLFREMQMRELQEFDQIEIDKADAAIREAKRAREEKKKADEEAEKAKAEKTLSLQKRLDIMLAKQAGDEEKARTLAIEGRYEAMKKGATEAQLAIINQMQAIEMAGVSSANQTNEGTGGTITASTAVGGFTIATGRSEGKKQTSLLQKIADSNQEVADALKKNGTSGELVVAQ